MKMDEKDRFTTNFKKISSNDTLLKRIFVIFNCQNN